MLLSLDMSVKNHRRALRVPPPQAGNHDHTAAPLGLLVAGSTRCLSAIRHKSRVKSGFGKICGCFSSSDTQRAPGLDDEPR